MRAVFGLVLVIGMGLAGFAVYMVKGHFDQQRHALAAERAAAAAIVPTIEVYAMVRAVDYGEPIMKEDVQLIRYVEAALPEGVFRTEAELFPEGEEELRIVTRRMEINEPVLSVKVSAPGESVGITSSLSPGMRAFTISVDATSGVSGFLRPGDTVDVYWTGRGGEEIRGGELTQLIQSSIKIIAIDQSADTGITEASVARTVTVEATPHQVAALAQAQSSGLLSLALVGVDAGETNQEIAINQAGLLGITEAAPIQIQEEKVCTIRTRRGAEVIEIPIPCSE